MIITTIRNGDNLTYAQKGSKAKIHFDAYVKFIYFEKFKKYKNKTM